MPKVGLVTSSFPAASGVQNQASQWDVSWPELLWAAITVGKGSFAHVIQHGPFSMFEITYRAAMIYANLTEGPQKFFIRSEAYDGLDPSEKGAISYFLGMALTKAFVSDKLSVNWLMHVDMFRKQFGVQLMKSGGRPDLFGMNTSGQWIVAESKGRTNGHSTPALRKAKWQATQVVGINGTPPQMALGVVSSFTKGRLKLVVEDPPIDQSGETLEWQVSPEDFKAAYYRPFLELLEAYRSQEIEVNGEAVQRVWVDSYDLFVGVSQRRLVLGATETSRRVIRTEQSFLGADGIYVELGPSWRDEVMRKEPQARRALARS